MLGLSVVGALVKGAFGLGTQFLENKKDVLRAKAKRESMALTNESDWNKIQAKNSGNSIKDEWLTLLVSIPLIMAFIPGMDVYVLSGFSVLDKMPDWYQYSVGIVFAASFGIKKAATLIRKR